MMSKQRALSTFTVLRWAPFVDILGGVRPEGRGRDAPDYCVRHFGTHRLTFAAELFSFVSGRLEVALT